MFKWIEKLLKECPGYWGNKGHPVSGGYQPSKPVKSIGKPPNREDVTKTIEQEREDAKEWILKQNTPASIALYMSMVKNERQHD